MYLPARRVHKIATPEEWTQPRINEREVAKNRGLRKGKIMFPTVHDITPAILEPCMVVLQKLLVAGNDVR